MSELRTATESCCDESESLVIPLGAGAILRAAREAQGLHIAMLSVALKVPTRKLEALEADRFDLLPDMVFVRALAASVCRVLRVDVGPVLSALPPSCHPQIKIDDAGLNAAYNDGSTSVGQSWLKNLRTPFNVTVLFVILATIAVAFFPDEWSGKNSSIVPSDDAQTAPAIKSISIGAMDAQVSSVSTQMLAQSVNPAKVVETVANVASEALVIPMQKAAESIPDANAGNETLILKALGDSWVEVKDAQGIVRLRRILSKGEMVPVAAASPMSVVLGRADLVSVFIRGKSFDTSSLTKENVARFEVK
jgi:cytoskeleton protein RodZ